MDTYRDIARSRRLVKIGIVIGCATALTLMTIRIINTDQMTVGEVLGSVALGAALATPPTLAVLSLDRRPSLLPAAIIGVLSTSIVAVWLLPVWLLTAFLWYRGWTIRPMRAKVSRSRAAGRIGLGFLMVASILALFVHMDPACTQTLNDGTTRSVDVSTRRLDSGWVWNSGNDSGSSSSYLGSDVASEVCTSDTIVPAEAVASIAITALVLEIGRRWPQGVHAPSESNASSASTRPDPQVDDS